MKKREGRVGVRYSRRDKGVVRNRRSTPYFNSPTLCHFLLIALSGV